ncbi:MAG: ActS/PrrB/RegB family redox-sensitive histidine kinase, partial [Pseudomonadota bacterium]
PFTLLFIAPVTISASVLSLRATLALSGLAFACITLLSFVYFPLPWSGSGADGFMLPGVYLIGIWASLVLGIGFTGAYAWRVAQERADMSNALAATQLVLAREQRLSALGGLAAAAAHELGTPLATIQLVAKEMARELSPSSPLAEDAQLLLSQSVRCREILGRLSSRGEEGDLVHGRMTLKGLLEEAATPHREGARIIIRTSGRPGASEPVVARQPEMLYGLSNLIENAVDFAESQVTLQAFWDENQVQITVQDDGPGFSADVIQRLGEPYVTTRGASLRGDTAKHPRGEYGGLGLGFFIAKTLLERTGARLRLNGPSEDAKGAARTPPATVGARVDIVWNRLSIEAPPTSSPKAKTARPASEGDETAA